MACFFNRSLTDEQLNAALDCEAASDVTDHLRQCPGCRARLDEMSAFAAVLKGKLHPDVQDLTDYQTGLLSKPETSAIARHLQTCSVCQEQLRQLDQLATLPFESKLPTPVLLSQPQKTLLTFPTHRIIKKQPNIVQNGVQVAGIGLLGGSRSFTVEFEGLEISLTQEPIRDGVIVSGQLLTTLPDAQTEWTGAIARISNGDPNAAVMTLLDEDGYFKFNDPVVGGTMHLVIRTFLDQAVSIDLQLGETES